ncbi:hypothetical protein ACIHFD_49555 [Nonomuraea sp. NPDC051941]|uniref:hypothetical protein n=1 Tax=Nonomuraea sp. NPDC051941 TaxID=3364373 RepID=UPI0037CBB00D
MLINSADAATDAAGIDFVERYQPRVPHWWLMYSRHKRSLVAFYQGYYPPPGLVVEAKYPDELLQRMSLEGRALWRSPTSQAARSSTLVENPPGPGRGTGR